MAALDAAGMPTDPPFRAAVREHVEFGTRVAMQNSHATTDAELHPLREVPRWTWPAATTDRRSGSSASDDAGVRLPAVLDTFRPEPEGACRAFTKVRRSGSRT